MPWKPSEALAHTKAADTPAKQAQWAKVANECLARGDDEATAIRKANAAVAKGGDPYAKPAAAAPAKGSPPFPPGSGAAPSPFPPKAKAKPMPPMRSLRDVKQAPY